MNGFQEKTASASSLACRKPVYGVGINDADYVTQPRIDGKRQMCPYYKRWQSMLERCYSIKFQEERPTYIGCTVCDEWLLFSTFKSWMKNQAWQGNQLDKDFKIKDNKIYSTETCLFIAQSLNLLLNDRGRDRGLYPVGVTFYKVTCKFLAQISIAGASKHLGYFDSPELASAVYVAAKNQEIVRQSNLPEHAHLKQYFNQHLLQE